MEKILAFRIGIEGLENKIWREIEITDRRTVADLAYTILASFNSLAYHSYKVTCKEITYYCAEIVDNIFDYKNAIVTKLSDLGLDICDMMEMEYDSGSTTTFVITYLGSRESKSYKEIELYPKVINGEGLGMIDDISGFELKDMVDDIDKLGYSNYYFTRGYENTEEYDYRDYDIKKDNETLKGKILAIKNGYEVR